MQLRKIFEKPNYKDYSMRYAKDFCARKFFWQRCSCLLLKLILFLFYKVKIHNKENIPEEQVIVAPNHTCYFDPFLSVLILWKPVAYMAKKELFEKNWLGSLMLDELCAFAVNREKLELSTIKTVKEIFKTKDWTVGIFPEGGIRRNKQFSKVTKGFAVIAQMGKRNILPMGIAGLETYNWNLFKKQELNVYIGKLIPYTDSVESIMDNWKHQLSEMTGYELVEEAPQEETVTVS